MALEGSTEKAQFYGVGKMTEYGGSDLSVNRYPAHAIRSPWQMADPLMADPSLMAACWEASDEMMPRGGGGLAQLCQETPC